MMQVSEAMNRNVCVANPQETIEQAATMMARLDTGFLPVGEYSRLVGAITDRDIAVRAVAAGKGPQTRIGEVMTYDIKYCFEDQEIEDVLRNMGDIQVRRLPVLDRDKQLVGVLSLGDIALSPDSGVNNGEMSAALAEISRPAGSDGQSR